MNWIAAGASLAKTLEEVGKLGMKLILQLSMLHTNAGKFHTRLHGQIPSRYPDAPGIEGAFCLEPDRLDGTSPNEPNEVVSNLQPSESSRDFRMLAFGLEVCFTLGPHHVPS